MYVVATIWLAVATLYSHTHLANLTAVMIEVVYNNY